MNIPKRRKRERLGVRESSVIRCAGHLKWVRGCECAVAGKITYPADKLVCVPHICSDRIEAAHVRTGTDGGTSMKPGDNWTLPLCSEAHKRQHQIGERSFEIAYQIDMKAIAAKLWDISPHGRKYRSEHQ